MVKEKEKDEVQEMFSRALEARENIEAEEEENEEVEGKKSVHYTEIISPIVALGLGIMSIFDKFWFTAYFGLIFAVLGIYICKKKGANRGIILFNVAALALCFFMGGLWIVLYASSKL